MSRLALTALIVLSCFLWSAPSHAAAGPKPGSVETLTWGTGDNAHRYLVYTPDGFTPKQQLPLVVMLHGCQTSAYQQMKANRYNQLADRRGFVVAYPDIDSTEAAQPGPLRNCWQYWNPANWQRGAADGAAVAGITRAVVSRWHIDSQRVYLMGMSAGAFLTADMAATYPDLYAAVGENAGGAYQDFECTFQSTATLPVTTSAKNAYDAMGSHARIVPKIVIGGDADQGIPPHCANKALAQSLRTNNLVIDHHQTTPISLTPARVQRKQVPGGYAYTVSTYVDQHRCTIGQRYLVHGMNHFWSGGSANPKWADFTDPKGPSAAVASWQFFSHFTLANTARSCGKHSSKRGSAWT